MTPFHVQDLLSHRVAEAAARRIVSRLVNSIRTPPHSPEPIATTVLVSQCSEFLSFYTFDEYLCYQMCLFSCIKEEDVFRVKNPGVSYK